MGLMKSTETLLRLCALSFVASLILFSGSLQASEPPKTLTNKDIKKMVKKGLGPQTIIAMIETHPGKYDTRHHKLAGLKKANVPDIVIAALIKVAKRSANSKEHSHKFQPLFGPGLTRLGDDYVDFKEVRDGDEHIFINNDSRFRPELMAGALLKLKEWKNKKTVDLVLGLEFTEGGQDALDGVFFGLGFGLTDNIEIVGGYSRSLGKELSPGFKRAMGHFIKEHETDPSFRDIDLVDGVIADIKDYDGLPLYMDIKTEDSTTKRKKIFPGNPIVNSFNSRLSFGILFKFDILKVFEDLEKATSKIKSR